MENAITHKNAYICSQGGDACPVISELAVLRQEVDNLHEQVRTDALTGLYNFRFFNETISLEMERTRRGAQPLSMILLDIDHFKNFNDQWGHEAGNHALQHIAKLIKIAVRKLDFPCRFGGEEFVILLPNTGIHQSIQVAERLREMIASSPVQNGNKGDLSITASMGVDQFLSFQHETSESFIRRVDSLLYEAKHQGRNRVIHAPIASSIMKESVTLEEKAALFDILGDTNTDSVD